jgi:DNA-binding transcriptional regulator YiaG
MSDEQYELMQDTREKKVTARSARHARTHCGKGGRVKFPSDYLSKKQLQAMNGNVKEYSMNKPINWETFKMMPQDLQIEYVKKMRTKFGVPDTKLADAMGANRVTFGKYIRCLGLGLGKAAGAFNRDWDDTEFNKFWNGVEETEMAMENIENVEAAESVEVTKPIRVNEPISYKEFKALPDELKIAYIKWLRETFNVPDNHIAIMMGVNRSTFSSVIIKLGLENIKNRGPRTNWDKEAFYAWFGGANPGLVKESPMVEDICEDVDVEVAMETLDKDEAETPVEAMPIVIPNTGVTHTNILAEKYTSIDDINGLNDRFNDIDDRIYKMDYINAKNFFDINDRIDKLSYSQEKNFNPGPIAFTGHYMPVIPKSGSMTFEHNSADDALATIKALLSCAKVNLSISWECIFDTESCGK